MNTFPCPINVIHMLVNIVIEKKKTKTTAGLVQTGGRVSNNCTVLLKLINAIGFISASDWIKSTSKRIKP